MGCVHWVGDGAEPPVPGVFSHSFGASRKRARAFEGIYKHRSSNSAAFELFCFQRWFAILETAQALGLFNEPILCLDSDVLLYRVPEFDERSGVDLATCRRSGPQFTWFRNLSVLGRFCEFIEQAFADPRRSVALDTFYETKVSPLEFHGGNVCDMHLMGLFALELGPRYRDLESVGDDCGVRYDDNLNVQNGFESERGTEGPKRIFWRDGLPHGRRDGRLVAFGGLHFQGGLKGRMVEFLTARKKPSEVALVLVRRTLRIAIRLLQGGSLWIPGCC